MIREALYRIDEAKGGIIDIKKLKNLFKGKAIEKAIKMIYKSPDMKDLVKHYEAAEASKVYFFPGSIALKMGGSKVRTGDFKDGARASFAGGSLVNFLTANGTNLILSYEKGKKISNRDKMIFLGLYALLIDDRAEAVEDKTEAVETAEVANVKRALKGLARNKNGLINLMIGSTIYEVDDFVQVGGRPKADMTFVDKKGRDIVFVSHKGGKVAGDFQQYGGAQDIGMDNSTGKTRLSSSADKDVQLFLKKVRAVALSKGAQMVDGKVDLSSLPKGSNYAFPVNDREIFGLVMFGKDYHSGKFGLNNCHILLDGTVTFEEVKKGVYKPVASFHSFVNPKEKGGDKFPTSKTDTYHPYFIMTRSSSQGLSQGGFKNARFGIWPYNKVVRSYSAKFADELSKI